MLSYTFLMCWHTDLIYDRGSLWLEADQRYRSASSAHVQICGRRDVILKRISKGERLNAPPYFDQDWNPMQRSKKRSLLSQSVQFPCSIYGAWSKLVDST